MTRLYGVSLDLIYPRVSIVYSWKCRCSLSDRHYRKRETILLTLIWPLGIKWKFRNVIAHLQDLPYELLKYHLSTLWNADSVLVTTPSQIIHILALRALGQKWKIKNLIAHLQDIPNQILKYDLTNTLDVDGVQVTLKNRYLLEVHVRANRNESINHSFESFTHILN